MTNAMAGAANGRFRADPPAGPTGRDRAADRTPGAEIAVPVVGADADAGLAQAPRLSLSMRDFEALTAKPLLALPVGLRPDALALWACHRHLAGLSSPLSIAGAVSVWVDRHGLTQDDAAQCLRDMLVPERMGEFKFAADLMTALAASCRQAIDRRRREADVRRMRDEEERARAEALPADELRALLRGFGAMPDRK